MLLSLSAVPPVAKGAKNARFVTLTGTLFNGSAPLFPQVKAQTKDSNGK